MEEQFKKDKTFEGWSAWADWLEENHSDEYNLFRAKTIRLAAKLSIVVPQLFERENYWRHVGDSNVKFVIGRYTSRFRIKSRIDYVAKIPYSAYTPVEKALAMIARLNECRYGRDWNDPRRQEDIQRVFDLIESFTPSTKLVMISK